MKTRQSKRLHNQNVGTTKPVHLHNNEETTMSKYLYYAGYVILAGTDIIFLLDVLPQMGSIWSEGGLDQPAQCYSGLFQKTVL